MHTKGNSPVSSPAEELLNNTLCKTANKPEIPGEEEVQLEELPAAPFAVSGVKPQHLFFAELQDRLHSF